jgi:hypothetical protein
MLKVIDRPAEDRRTLDKKRIAETWQQYYETRGYDLWGFSPSPAARPRLSMVWVLDAATGKPVGHWVVEVSEPAVVASAA